MSALAHPFVHEASHAVQVPDKSNSVRGQLLGMFSEDKVEKSAFFELYMPNFHIKPVNPPVNNG